MWDPSSFGSGTEITGLDNEIETEILLHSDQGLKSRDWTTKLKPRSFFEMAGTNDILQWDPSSARLKSTGLDNEIGDQ